MITAVILSETESLQDGPYANGVLFKWRVKKIGQVVSAMLGSETVQGDLKEIVSIYLS
jgi:hypothetical protein